MALLQVGRERGAFLPVALLLAVCGSKVIVLLRTTLAKKERT